MTNFFAAVGCLFEGVWDLLTTVEYPGTTLTFAAILVGAFCAVVSLRIAGSVMGVHFGDGVVKLAGGNNKNIKVSDARKNDSISNKK